MAKEQLKGKDAGSDSSTESGHSTEEFDASKCLVAYGLADVDQGHMITCNALEKSARSARENVQKAKGKTVNFLFDKGIEKCSPLWVKDGDRPGKAAMTHAQWGSHMFTLVGQGAGTADVPGSISARNRVRVHVAKPCSGLQPYGC